MSDRVERLLARQRDRAIAIILALKENECDDYLPPEVQRRLRKVVLDQLNEFTTFAVDIASSGDLIINDLFMEKLEAIHERVMADG